jgi:hypothetical protein
MRTWSPFVFIEEVCFNFGDIKMSFFDFRSEQRHLRNPLLLRVAAGLELEL